MKIIKPAVILLLFAVLATCAFAKGIAITDMSVRVDYDESYVYKLENKDKIDFVEGLANNSKINADVFPGSNVTFTMRLANTFSNGGPDLKKALVRAKIRGIDDGSDLEDVSDEFFLEPGDDPRIDIKFSVPLDVAKGTYSVVLDGEAEDRNSTFYSSQIILKLEVKKESHDIRITKMSANPSIIECSRKMKISAGMINVGSNNEDQLALELHSDTLGINSVDRDVSLQTAEDAAQQEKIYVKNLDKEVPQTAVAGRHQIIANLYWKNTILFDRKFIDVIVRNCGAPAQNNPPQNQNNQSQQPVPQTPDHSGGNAPSGSGVFRNASLTGSPALVFMIIAGFLVIFISVLIIAKITKFK